MATQQQFIDFLRDIEPSKTTKQVCSSAHTTLRGKLASHDTYKNVHNSTFLSGSYTRDTALRPQTVNGELKRPDVDIIVVTNYITADKPSGVISTLRRALKQLGYTELESNRRSVSVTLASVDMDVVPIIKDPWTKQWLIADKKEDRWLTTNPLGHTEWAAEVNKRTNGNFKPLVKLLKWWKRVNLPNLRRPKGFILETLVAAHMDPQENSYEQLFAKLLEKIKDKYSFDVWMGSVPTLEDPSVPGNNVFSRVEPKEFKRFHDMISEHADLVRRAQKETDPEKELKLWVRVFGDRFPEQGSKSHGLLRRASAATGGLSFPAKAVTPPNKPSGFA